MSVGENQQQDSQAPNLGQSQAPPPAAPTQQEPPPPAAPVAAPVEELKTVWIYINRNPFPVYVPDPRDPSTRVLFPPIPDKKQSLRVGDFHTNPFYKAFTKLQRSISAEPAPAAMGLTLTDIDDTGEVHTLANMTPDVLSTYIGQLIDSNPEIAGQVLKQLQGRGRQLSVAPPGA